MPTYGKSSELHNDEWILFQVKEGPCNAGCDYCYENAHIRTVIESAQQANLIEAAPIRSMNTLELARFTQKHSETLHAEMSIEEIDRYFQLLARAGISRAALIGSEPTSHSEFELILDSALASQIDLLVYTSGLAPKALQHPAIKWVVLHLDFGRLGEDVVERRIKDKSLPSDSYMREIQQILEAGKKIDLRVNFSDPNLSSRGMIVNFFQKVPERFHHQTRIKYSFSTRVAGEPDLAYFDPQTLRACVPTLTSFIRTFKEQFPQISMFSERPLFPCAFDAGLWEAFEEQGGLVSSCDMEFTFYPRAGLALCPPSRALMQPSPISTVEQLRETLSSYRSYVRSLYREPSFPECVPCSKRDDLSCQGGCLGYKAKQSPEKKNLVSISMKKDRASDSRVSFEKSL